MPPQSKKPTVVRKKKKPAAGKKQKGGNAEVVASEPPALFKAADYPNKDNLDDFVRATFLSNDDAEYTGDTDEDYKVTFSLCKEKVPSGGYLIQSKFKYNKLSGRTEEGQGYMNISDERSDARDEDGIRDPRTIVRVKLGELKVLLDTIKIKSCGGETCTLGSACSNTPYTIPDFTFPSHDSIPPTDAPEYDRTWQTQWRSETDKKTYLSTNVYRGIVTAQAEATVGIRNQILNMYENKLTNSVGQHDPQLANDVWGIVTDMLNEKPAPKSATVSLPNFGSFPPHDGGAAAKKKKTSSKKKVTLVVRKEKFDDGATRSVCKVEGKGNTLYTQFKGTWVSVARLKARLAKDKREKERKAKAAAKAAKAKKKTPAGCPPCPGSPKKKK